MVTARVGPTGEGVDETHLDQDDDVLHGDGCEIAEQDPFLEAWRDEEVLFMCVAVVCRRLYLTQRLRCSRGRKRREGF